MTVKVYILITISLVAISWLIAQRRAHRLRNWTGCVACGSENLQPLGNGQVLCQDCGYEGKANGGGDVSSDQIYDFSRYGE